MSTQQMTPTHYRHTLPTAADVHRWCEGVVLMGESSAIERDVDLHPSTFENYFIQLDAHRTFVEVCGIIADTELTSSLVAARRDLVLHATELHYDWDELYEVGQHLAKAKMPLAIQHFPSDS